MGTRRSTATDSRSRSGGRGGGDPRIIRAQLSSTNLTGICINKGTTTAPDFAFPVFGEFHNPKWEAEEGASEIGAYAETEYLAIRTKQPVPANEWINMSVWSFDFGGRATLRVTADGCEPFEPVQIPTDSDGDRLPDEWEKDQRFFDAPSGKLKKYDISLPKTDLVHPDADTDFDIGYVFAEHLQGQALRNAFKGALQGKGGAIPKRVHDEVGDGFTAFEEYRGVFVQGVFRRMDELGNDGGLTPRVKGTALKDVFTHDPDSLVDPNVFILKHGISYHRIQLNEMTDSGTTAAPQGGIVDFNGEGQQQRAIFIRKFVITDPGVFGDANSFSINIQPVAIDIDAVEIASHADFTIKGTGAKDSAADLSDFVVAHEVGHKLDLRHTEREIVNSANVFIDEYNNGIYAVQFVTPQKAVVWGIFQILVNPSSGAEGLSPLEILPPQADKRIFDSPTAHDSKVVEPIILHGVFHSARRFRYTPVPAFPGTPLPTLRYWVHTGDLMDWTHEHAGLEPRLSQEQRAKMKIVN